MLVTGCASSQVGSIKAMQQEVTPLAQEHAARLAECTDPVCNSAVLSGTRFIRGYLAGVGQLSD